MVRIAITPPDPVECESRIITRLLEDGSFDIVHLRHPGIALDGMRDIIMDVPQHLHGRLRLHDHFSLACEFDLGGLHLNRRCPEPPPGYDGRLSRSCHSVDEVISCVGCSYVTLSPVFDSVSKAGYRAAFTPDELRRLDAVDTPGVIALGGVTPGNLHLLSQYNFAGYAMLGAVGWNNRTINT